jgi:hypothetical protein
MEVGGISSAHVDGEGSYLVGSLNAIVPAKPEQAQIEKEEKIIQDNIVNEILQQYATHLHKEYRVTVNNELAGTAPTNSTKTEEE